jgi:hypothetical protein
MTDKVSEGDAHLNQSILRVSCVNSNTQQLREQLISGCLERQ